MRVLKGIFGGSRKENSENKKDVSFLLTVEIFLLTGRLFYLRWGNRKQKDQTQFPDGGGTVSKKDQT